jgi:hypothetical protein
MRLRRALASAAGAATLLVPLYLARAQDRPAHPHGDLRADCATCHTSEAWAPLRDPLPFEHAATGFPLAAAHSQAGCRDCHQSLVFSHVATACADCHRDAHRGELGPQCDRCHEPTSWTNRLETFRVHARTRFPLLAAHAGVDCEACHRGPQPREFVNTPTECAACHLEDWRAARDPDHERLGLSRRCEECHGAASPAWRGGTFPGSFPHPASFPLTGAHARVSCTQCHVAGFAGTPTDCVACHRDDYDRTTNPDHRTSGFPTTCESCHGTGAWRPATVDHSLTRFPLTGAHRRLDCAQCHTGGAFRGTPTDCVACHRDDYDRTTNPDHRASGFPTGCDACHTTNAWRPASFDHDRFFPIDSGRHRGIDCATCHTNPGNFRVFSCTNCHEHRQSEMDEEHEDVRGYVYESAACYRCHPRGTE